MITLQVYMTINPEHCEEFLEKAKVLTAATQAEEGNISYRLYEDVEQRNRFVMLEEWADEAAIEAHNKTPHFMKFVKFAQGVLIEPLNAKRI
ncbi:putative quinol monooxygenase [Ectobacillus panaciterrae]|uniref:putative quinol monooxygenase n=1 Tax=Ectobacillus panaciterrae TaxID=363872 RepID=UPI000420EE1F|nr:putative quinol monooxygenase [Ectobacillus panaciterrae]